MAEIKKHGTGRIKHFLVWLFLGKRLLLSDDNKLKCPRCLSKMKKIEKENITIDVCEYCEGMWLDHGEIEQINKVAVNKLNKQKNKSQSKNFKKMQQKDINKKIN
jgi:Zn-finger nucleic acid-binding protein